MENKELEEEFKNLFLDGVPMSIASARCTVFSLGDLSTGHWFFHYVYRTFLFVCITLAGVLQTNK
jgi:hypothetical protein